MTRRSRAEAAWPHARVVLIFLHVLAVGVVTLHDPPDLRRRVPPAGLALIDRISGPLFAYTWHAGVHQGWRMFVQPSKSAARVHVDVERDGAFQPVFVSRSDTHEWRRHQFDHVRFRKTEGLLKRSRSPQRYREFSRWVARAAASDFPDATRVRMRLERWETPPPDEARVDAPRVFESEQVFDLAQVRRGARQ